jgi:hypothetical protein
MTYGTADQRSAKACRERSINLDAEIAAENAETGIEISILVGGTLDESFIIKDSAPYAQIVDAIYEDGLFDVLIGEDDGDWNVNEHFQVDAHRVYIGDDYIEGDGQGTLYSRSAEAGETVPATFPNQP